MIRVVAVFSLVIIIETALCVFLCIKLYKEKKEKESFKLKYNNIKTSINRIEENIINANEKKNKLNTGNTIDDINNAADIMHQSSKRRKSTS